MNSDMTRQDRPPAFRQAVQEEAGQVLYGGFTFEVVRALADFEVELLRIADAVVVDRKAIPDVMDVIRPIRQHSDRAIYLKPVFILAPIEDASAVVRALSDGHVYSLDRMEDAAAFVERVIQQEEAFEQAHAVNFEDNTLTKLLRYMVSRGQTMLEPIPSRAAKLGFAYPIVDINYAFRNEQKSHGVLEQAEQEQLLAGEFVDAWYVCSTCSEAHIHLREVCPDCATADLKEEELIHHFRCAYVGPVSDFVNPFNIDDLLCPKCERKLNHVGVDYDKPASIFTCQNGHTSQAPNLVARCFTCGSETQAEHLTKRVFKRYELTTRGREKAFTGVGANVDALGDIAGTVSAEVFRTMLAYEVERMKVAGTASTLGLLHFGNAGELFSFVGPDARTELLRELAGLVRHALPPSDVIAFVNFSSIACLIPSMQHEAALDRLHDVADQARLLVARTFEGYEARMLPAAEPIDPERGPEVQLETLIMIVDGYE